MTRTAQIASIIEKRQPLVAKIATVSANLYNLQKALQQLEADRVNIVTRIDDFNIVGKLEEINLTNIQLLITTELEVLAKLKARFSRHTLNIGVVGRARQGKSRLLQSLTGLTATEIPDGDRQHCTGVRSIIHHNPYVDTYGEVWFFSERAFLDEIIAPYYDKLGLDAKPMTINEFADNPLPPLGKNLPGYAEPGAMYEHLSKYHINIAKYRHLFNQKSPLTISREEIRKYVAQDTPTGDRIFFNYLAVKEVKITCNFPNEDVGKIALVDMPGLGDTGIGDQERLMTILGQDVDAVLFVRMPKSSGDYWADVDVKLYDTARSSLLDLPINLWSFMVLNRTNSGSKNGDNLHNCQDLAETIQEKHIDVAKCLIANCASLEEADQVLDELLTYLASNIINLDSRYAQACQERLIILHNTVKAEIEKATIALGIARQSPSEFPLFISLFERLWSELTTGLEGLIRQLEKQREDPDLDLKSRVDEAIAICRVDTGLPSISDIEIRRDRLGGYPNAYYEYMNEIRTHLSQHFLSLDDGLKRVIKRVKYQVAEILIKNGNLGRLTQEEGAEFLQIIAEQIPEELVKLKLGFKIINEFDLSYRGLIQHRIRKQLDGLTPDRTSLQLSGKVVEAQEILTYLQTLQAEAVYQCQTTLEALLFEPSQAAFAIVEEFVDRVLRAEGVKTEWQIFLEMRRSFLWQEEFNELGERSLLRSQWLKSLELANTANQLDAMQFLN